MYVDKKHQQELEDNRNALSRRFDEIESGVVAQLQLMKSADGSLFAKLQKAYDDIVVREKKFEQQLARKRELAGTLGDVKSRLDDIRAWLASC